MTQLPHLCWTILIYMGIVHWVKQRSERTEIKDKLHIPNSQDEKDRSVRKETRMEQL